MSNMPNTIDIASLTKDEIFSRLQELHNNLENNNNQIDELQENIAVVTKEIGLLTQDMLENQKTYDEDAGKQLAASEKLYLLKSEFCELCKEIERKNQLIDADEKEYDQLKSSKHFNEFSPATAPKTINNIKQTAALLRLKAKLKFKSFSKKMKNKTVKFVNGKKLNLSLDLRKKLAQKFTINFDKNTFENKSELSQEDIIHAEKTIAQNEEKFGELFEKYRKDPNYRPSIEEIKEVQKAITKSYNLQQKQIKNTIMADYYNMRAKMSEYLDKYEGLKKGDEIEFNIDGKTYKVNKKSMIDDFEKLYMAIEEDKLSQSEVGQKLQEEQKLAPKLLPEGKEETIEDIKVPDNVIDTNQKIEPEIIEDGINNIEEIDDIQIENSKENPLSFSSEDLDLATATKAIENKKIELNQALEDANQRKIKWQDKAPEINEDPIVIELQTELQTLREKLNQVQQNVEAMENQRKKLQEESKTISKNLEEIEQQIKNNKDVIDIRNEEIKNNAANRESAFGQVENTTESELSNDRVVLDAQDEIAKLQEQKQQLSAEESKAIETNLDQYSMLVNIINSNDNLTEEEKKQARDVLYQQFDNYANTTHETTKSRAR